jgi:hypothetical protein
MLDFAISDNNIQIPLERAMSDRSTRIEIGLCILLIVVAAAFSGFLLRPCRSGDWGITAGSVVALAGCPREESAEKLLWQRAPQTK